MITKMHYFFNLSPSSSPFLASLVAFNFMISLLIMMKYTLTMNFFLSLTSIIMISFFWWIFYGLEFNLNGLNSLNLESGLKTSMILFISSEIFFFFSFFWSYFHYFLSPLLELGLSWPPVSILFFDYTNLPFINTLLLLTSGLTLTLTHHYYLKDKNNMSKIFMIVTISLGMLFTALQSMEYKSSFFSISDSTFGSSFFMLTGFHGTHVIIGAIFLMVVYMQMRSMMKCKIISASLEMSSWYWHFVDVVWIFLYFLIYFLV